MSNQRTLRNKPLAILLAILALAAALPTGASVDQFYQGRYTLGATPFVPEIGCITLDSQPTLCAVAGLIVCEEGILGLDAGIGGSCTPLVARRGAQVVTTANDGAAPALSWAMCIDGDGDGVCRPEGANLGSSYSGWADTIVLTACAQDQGQLNVVNQGSDGNVFIFIMMEPLGTGCMPTSGVVTTFVQDGRLPECADGVDNDGDGWHDYPLDPDCSSLGDDSEAPPPPPRPIAAH